MAPAKHSERRHDARAAVRGMILRSLAGWLSPAGPQARLSILTFHRVLREPDALLPDEPDVRRFDEELRWLGKWFRILALDEAARRLHAGKLPDRAAVITFDDGYANNFEHALPILQRHGVSATFFVTTGFLDGGRMWNDSIIETVRRCRSVELDLDDLGLGRHGLVNPAARRAAIAALIGKIKYLEPPLRAATVEQVRERASADLPDDLMMTSAQVVKLHRAGMQIGAHTCTHPILARIGDAEAEQEIRRGKEHLEALLEAPVNTFAYPNGRPQQDYRASHVAMVRAAGFTVAVSTAAGAATQASDLLQLPRFKPWDRRAWRYGMRMLGNLRAPAAQLA